MSTRDRILLRGYLLRPRSSALTTYDPLPASLEEVSLLPERFVGFRLDTHSSQIRFPILGVSPFKAGATAPVGPSGSPSPHRLLSTIPYTQTLKIPIPALKDEACSVIKKVQITRLTVGITLSSLASLFSGLP
jgi:hypothetical protein